MSGMFSTIIESIAPRQDEKSFQAILVLSWQDDKVYSYGLTWLGPLLPVGLEVGIHHDLFAYHVEAYLLPLVF